MNILQLQNTLKDLSDNQLQQQLLNPNGSTPGFLVLTELQRRKDMRDNYSQQQASGKSMAEEYATGIGGADVGKYTGAMKQAAAVPPQGAPQGPPSPQMPSQGPQMPTQGFAEGGSIQIGGFNIPGLGAPNGQQGGIPNFSQGMSIPTLGTRNRRYLGPGTISPSGVEQLYFSTDNGLGDAMGGLGGMAPGGSGTVMQDAVRGAAMMNAMMDGSANGATGAAGAGSVGAGVGEGASVSGGEAGTVGASVGGNAGAEAGVSAGEGTGGNAGVGGGSDGVGSDSGTWAEGGLVGIGLVKNALKYAGGGQVAGGYFGEDANGNSGLFKFLPRRVDDQMDPAMGLYRGITEGDSFGDIMKNTGGMGDPGLAGLGAALGGGSFGEIAGTVGKAMLGPVGGLFNFAGGGSVMPNMDEENALANVPDVPDTFVRDTRTMKEKFRDAMQRRSTDMGSAAIEGLKGLPWREYYDKNRAMVDKERQKDERFWTPEPGKSWGQSVAERIQGRIPDTNVGEATSPFDAPQEAPRGLPGAVSSVYPDPSEATGVPNNVGQDQNPSANASVLDPTDPGGGGILPAGVAPPRGGRDPVGRGKLNIGGEGLEDYMAQIRGLQQADGFGAIEQGIRDDREELKRGENSDKGLALLTAGLGIMGGESPHFAVNVGKGAQAGVAQYNQLTKEQRQAKRDLRNAENQIALGRANRDERQLEKGLSLYARAQENLQRSMDRESREGISSADRAANRAIAQQRVDSETADRRERAEQARISDFGTRANQYGREADALDMKAATLANNIAGSPEGAAEIAKIKQQADALRAQAHQYGQMYNRSIIEREVKSGRLASPKTEAEYDKLKPGTRYLHTDGQLKVKP
jgi:hypothetical protein